MKKQKLTSLLAIPIITIFSGCGINNDQIRIPNHTPYKYNINNKEIRAYRNMFSNSYSNFYIIEVRENNKLIRTYIGNNNPENPRIDYVEEGKRLFNRKHINSYPKEEQEKLRKKYKFYISELNKISKK